jgi:hypothetical protein
MIGLLALDGSFLCQPVQCKDFIHDTLTAWFYPDYVVRKKIWNPSSATTRPPIGPDVERPNFVLYCCAKNREKNGNKFLYLINQVEDAMGLPFRSEVDFPDCKDTKDAPFRAFAPSFWINSPIAVSAYATFMRLSIRMHKEEALRDFIKRIIALKEDGSDVSMMQIAARGNLDRMLARDMPALNREGRSDYLLSSHNRNFAHYSPASDKDAMDEATLLKTKLV